MTQARGLSSSRAVVEGLSRARPVAPGVPWNRVALQVNEGVTC